MNKLCYNSDKLADEVYVDTETDEGEKEVEGSPELDMEEVEETNGRLLIFYSLYADWR